MFIDLETLPGPARYKLLTAAIVPRPIAWIVSRDARRPMWRPSPSST